MNELLRRRGQEMSEGINWARALPLLAGGTLITLGVQRRSKVGWLLAAAGGGIATYSLMCEMTEAEPPAGRYVKRAITIGAPPEQIYEFWSKADNLKRMIPGVADIQPSAGGTWNWRFEGPVGTTLQWETELLENEPGRLMHWQTKGNPVIEHHGRLEFRPAPADRGTEVTFTVSWKPTGPVTQAVSGLGLIGKAAGWHASEALRRAKQLIETGELSTASIGA